MPALSIRARLTAWNGAVMAVIAVGLGVATYAVMGQALMRRTDSVLRFEYDETVERLEKLGSSDDLGAIPEAFLQTFLLRVIDADGQVRLQSPRLTGIEFPATPDVRNRDAPRLYTARLPSLGEQRVISGTVAGTHGSRTVQISTSLDEYAREMRELRRTLLFVLPLALLAAVLGGYWLAARALRPVHDMTETARRISAQNLREQIEAANPNDELGRLAHTLNAMVVRLGDALDSMRRFTADASHELMTPLTAIRTEAEVALQARRSAEEYAEVLASIIEEVDRLSTLAGRLLLLAREDARPSTPRTETVCLNDAISGAVEWAKPLAERARVAIAVESACETSIRGDHDCLRQVFINLLDNAIKYNREGGSIAVSSEHLNKEVVVEIRDTGIGIPSDAIPHIFDRFYRVDRARSRRTGGTGLGLSIAKALVESLQGRIEVVSTLGQGATFRVFLPIAGHA